MSVCGKFEISITTSTQEEMDRIVEAIYSGYAETVIKQHVLWSQFMPPVSTAAPSVATTSSAMPSDPGPGLQRVETRVKAGAGPSSVEKKERVTGVIGRGRMGRAKS